MAGAALFLALLVVAVVVLAVVVAVFLDIVALVEVADGKSDIVAVVFAATGMEIYELLSI